jgi:hypothetical protein
MDFIRGLLEQQPLLALFLTIALGYLVGEINIKGFSLGAGAVLFVALVVGWFAPKSAPAPVPAPRRCRPPSSRWATTMRRSVIRSPIPSAWQARSWRSTSPSSS